MTFVQTAAPFLVIAVFGIFVYRVMRPESGGDRKKAQDGRWNDTNGSSHQPTDSPGSGSHHP